MTSRTYVSRRYLLAGLAAGVAAAGAWAAPALQLSWTRASRAGSSFWRGQSRTLATAGLDEWASQVGSEFAIRSESGMGVLKLDEVNAFPTHGRRPAELGRSRAFAAKFSAANGAALPDGDRTYAINHPKYGTADVYFSPSGEKLVAVFN